MADIEKIQKEYEEILNQLGDPELLSDWERFEELTKKKTYLEKIIDKDKEIKDIKDSIEENKSIMAGKEDPELSSLAEAEFVQLQEKQKTLEKEINDLMNNNNESTDQPKAIIVEIRAGTGGDEAGLFASDLYKMYSRYAQNQKWTCKLLDSKPNEVGGIKEIIFEVKGNGVFSKMKNEGGVHRVQRIPETEKSGRIHTSTASVAVLAKPKKAQIKINPAELKIDTYRASGPGGQYVNKRETAIRITHLPTGIVVTSQTERNQLQNKENALAILEARILEKKELEDMKKQGATRNLQIGEAKRSEKIRTYNFPQDRITDHRIKKSFHNIESVMEGKLDPITGALEKADL